MGFDGGGGAHMDVVDTVLWYGFCPMEGRCVTGGMLQERVASEADTEFEPAGEVDRRRSLISSEPNDYGGGVDDRSALGSRDMRRPSIEDALDQTKDKRDRLRTKAGGPVVTGEASCKE
ncbi:hypothetical protein CORC01_00212 [Colletotrichum orchidophilum]|uniref:Uncharacterized protein n=1 Tax=Colletotrichum orchidophilum TaxID=1209926 RepID=A0A1G4BSJ0_9PEZI|nr:uncharacterized protein CORC01_00212 [Colletotrichum orchidophilum]OHF04360.1 hypothetical protein CORC01_00212 [Colletotrichum orchidophilum]